MRNSISQPTDEQGEAHLGILKGAALVGLGFVAGVGSSEIFKDSTREALHSTGSGTAPEPLEGENEPTLATLVVPNRIPIEESDQQTQLGRDNTPAASMDPAPGPQRAPLPPRPYSSREQAILGLADAANEMYQARNARDFLELGYDAINTVYGQALLLFRDTIAASTPPDYTDLHDFPPEIQREFAVPGMRGVFSIAGPEEGDGPIYFYADNVGGRVSATKIDTTTDIGTLLTTYYDAREILTSRDAE